MRRFASETALATVIGLSLAMPAAAQSGSEACPAAAFDSDADRDGAVSAEEARSAAEREFARFDMNRDEAVTREEFVECYGVPSAAAAQGGDAEETAAASDPAIPEADAAAGGEATGAATASGGSGADAGTVETTAASESGIPDADAAAGGDGTEAAAVEPRTRDEDSFAEADRNSDGTLDRAEFGIAAQKAFEATRAAGPALSPDAERDENVAVPGEANETDEVTQAEAGAQEAAEREAAEQEAAAEDAAEVKEAEDAEATAEASEPAAEEGLAARAEDAPGGPSAEEIAFDSARLFAALDADRSESLDPVEWMRIGPIAERGPAEVGRVFERIDLDGDSRVTVAEYVTSVLAAHASAAEAAAGGDAAPQASQGTDEAGSAASGDAATGEAPLFLYRIYRY